VKGWGVFHFTGARRHWADCVKNQENIIFEKIIGIYMKIGVKNTFGTVWRGVPAEYTH